MKIRLTLLALLAFNLAGLSTLMALKVPSVFSDRMVVQVDRPLAIWGWAEPGEEVTIEDILVGEVWLASGQSNMEWTMNQLEISEDEKAAADFPRIRVFTAERTISEEPLDDVAGEWRICTPDNAGDCSGTPII